MKVWKKANQIMYLIIPHFKFFDMMSYNSLATVDLLQVDSQIFFVSLVFFINKSIKKWPSAEGARYL